MLDRWAKKRSDPPPRVRREVTARSGGECEARIPGVCDITAIHLHHVSLRARGGRHTEENLVHVCGSCHEWAHQHPVEATARGLIASRTGDPT